MSKSELEQKQVGPFLILRRLGNKRQRVFEASQTEQNRKVALKFISLPPDVSREHALKKIQKEVRYLQRLSHPHLTQFYGAGIDGEQVFFAMELVEGEPLSAILSRRGRIAWDLAVEYALQLADVLDYLHSRELLHSKLTPEKILISHGEVKLTDLRMNRARRRRWDAKKREELEVAAYLAPEQLLGEGATIQSDLYSLGAILYEMITGKMPYPPESLERMARRKRQQTVQPPSQLAVDSPIWLDKVIQTLMNPDPRQRYLSAAAARMALAEIQKIDANQTSTVAQMAGGFNALTAGADKSEARRLLGKQEPLSEKQLEKKRQKEAIPFYMQTWLLVIGLIAASSAIGAAIYMITPSPDSALAEANRILADDDAGLLAIRSSENKLNKMIDWDPDGPRVPDLEDAIESLKIKRLMRLARQGHVGLQEPLTKLFINAYQADVSGDYRDALATYRKLLTQIPVGDERKGYMRREAVRQMEAVRERFAEKFRSDLEVAETLENSEDALPLALAIKSELGADPRFADWVSELEQRFPKLQDIEPLDGKPESDTETESDTQAEEEQPATTTDDVRQDDEAASSSEDPGVDDTGAEPAGESTAG